MTNGQQNCTSNETLRLLKAAYGAGVHEGRRRVITGLVTGMVILTLIDLQLRIIHNAGKAKETKEDKK